MLPAPRRLRRSAQFTSTVRRGRRAGSGRLVVHLAPGNSDLGASPDAPSADCPAVAGFVVSRAVGPAVVRNRVRRRLSHLVAERLDRLPAGSELVVRALPAAASTRSSGLAADLDRALDRLLATRRADSDAGPSEVGPASEVGPSDAGSSC